MLFLRKKYKNIYLSIVLLITIQGISQSTTEPKMTWDIVTELPEDGVSSQIGFAGSFAGISNNVMLIAGGANFPNGMTWDGGEKNYTDQIFVLEKKENQLRWNSKTFKLQHPLAYGSSLNVPDGVLCIGGRNRTKIFSEVFLLTWDVKTQEVVTRNLPSLPFPLAHFSASIIDSKVYIAGGESSGSTTSHFLVLDLSQTANDQSEWQILPSLPGKSRAFSILQAQSNGVVNGLYLFSGRTYDGKGNIEFLKDGYFFSPIENKWQALESNSIYPVMAGNSFEAGLEFIFLPSGSNGQESSKLRALEKSIKEFEILGNENKVNELRNNLNDRLINHPGFSKDVVVYNTITKTNVKIAELPYGVVTAPIVNWDGDFYIVSGEIRPGVRTPTILRGHINIPKNTFGWLNMLVLIVYFGLLLFMGYYFSKRQKSTEDYFKGGGRVPWWAAGLSIFGTGLSAITFMAIPAKAYATDWAYIWLNGGVLLMAPIIIYYFIPVFRKLNISSAYQYLELRFNVTLRLIGSLSFILFQIGRMAVVLFLPSIAINVVMGIDIYACILAMGVFSLLYTLMGGIEAVIWTDAMQVIVLLGGAILCLILMISNIEGGFSEIVNTAIDNKKFNAFNMAFDWDKPTFWVVIFGGFFASLATYGSDQTMVQRYLTTSDQKGAVKSLLTNVWLTVPATLLFFFVGTALFVFFKQNPESMNLSLSNGDAIFPWYIVQELPDGVVGILISGILAAAMSSVSSSMNSAATSYSIDIHFRFWKSSDELKLARIATLIFGVSGTLVALFMAGFEIKSLWDVFNKVLGLIIGSMSGLFILGILVKRSNSTGAIIGFVGSLLIQIYIASQSSIHLLLYTGTGMISCVVLGVLGSVIFPEKEVIKKK